MSKRIPRRRVVIALLAAVVLAGGCGIYKKRSANKAIQRVEEKSRAEAQQAEANRYATDLFQKLEKQIADAKEKVNGGQYEEAITLAQEAEATAQSAIRTARAEKAKIDQKRTEIAGILTQAEEFLTKAKGAPPESVPENEVTSAQESIAGARNLLQEQSNKPAQKLEEYDAVVESASAAYRAAQYAYNLTLQEQANELAGTITKMREELTALSPDKYMPDESKAMTARLDNFDALMREQRYEEALALGDELKTSITEFTGTVRQRRADAELKEAQNQHDAVLAQGAEVYALEPMKRVESALAAAKTALEAGKYDEAYDSAIEAQKASTDARAEILSRAEEIVQRVREEIDAAEKEGAREYTPQTLQQARKQYGDASLALERGELKTAIETGTAALQQAGAAILETKKEKAKLALDRSQRSIDIAIEEGANTYAPEELAKAREKHRIAEQRFKDGDYAQVHQLAAEAEEQSSHVLEVLAGKTREFIQQAEAARIAAATAGASELAADTLAQADQSLGESRSLLGGRRYLQAINAAKHATDLGREAEATAYRLRSDSMMAQAQAEIEEAQKAGAPNYAAQAYNNALDELRQAQERYNAQTYAESLAHATKAVEQAVKARRAKLDAAIAAVDSASAALASQYAGDTYNQALETLSASKRAMGEKSYDEANKSADRAQSLATRAEQDAWKARGEEIANNAGNRLDYLTANLGQQKCPDEMANARLMLTDTRNFLGLGQFRKAYDRGVETREAVETAESCLAGLAETAYKEFSDRYNALAALANDPEGRREVERLFPTLSQVEQALADKGYRVVFEQTAAGTTLAQNVETNLIRHNIEARIASLRKKIAEYKSNGKADILPTEFGRLEQEVMSLEPAVLPVDYQKAMASLDDTEDRVNQYSERVDMAVDSVLLDVKQTLTEARHAGALRYVRGQYENAVDLYKQAVALPSRENYHELAASVHAASEAASKTLSRTLISIDETRYKDLIRNYMLEMNSLLDQWPFSPERGSGKYSMQVVLSSASSRDIDVYHELQRNLTDVKFRDRTRELYKTVEETEPPPSMRELHADVLNAFRTVSEAADFFFRYGLYSIYGSAEREQFLKQAYEKLKELKEYTVVVQARLEGLEPPKKEFLGGVFHTERGWDPRNYFWIRYED